MESKEYAYSTTGDDTVLTADVYFDSSTHGEFELVKPVGMDCAFDI